MRFIVFLIGLVLIQGCGNDATRTENEASKVTDAVGVIDLFKVCNRVFAHLGRTDTMP